MTDTFWQDGANRCFLLIKVAASSQLHQVTVERDFKFYRRAEYQNRPMTADEVRLRMEAILSGRRGTDELFEDEIARLEEIMHGPHVALLAIPTIEHRLAADPAEPNVRLEIARLAQAHDSDVDELITSGVKFAPTGDGMRATKQYATSVVETECRVRRNSFVTHAQSAEAIDEQDRSLFVSRTSPANNLWRVRVDRGNADEIRAQSASGRPSTIVDPAVAVSVHPIVLRLQVRAFLRLISRVYDLGGWRGPIRLDAVVSGRSAFPAVGSGASFLLSETNALQASIEFDYESMELRSEELTDELMRGLARNFGLDEFAD